MYLLTFLFLLAYLSGSIPFGVILSKQENITIIEHGSGNIGATNVFRTVGKKAGLLTFAGDFLKGLLPVLLALFLTQSEYAVGIAGFLAVIGHMYPVFLKFKGGKGVATSLGVFLGMMPLMTLLAMLIWVIICLLFRYVSLGSIIALLSVPVTASLFGESKFYVIISALLAVLIVYKHRGNIQRLRAGEENKISLGKK